MDILDSAWFLRMLSKAGANPRERLLAVFDVLGDWIDAPHMRQQLADADSRAIQPQALLDYLSAEARAAGVQQAELLAQQLCCMARGMLQEELRAPGSAASRHARQAAQALIEAQTQKSPSMRKRSAYALAAGVCLCLLLGGSLLKTGADASIRAVVHAAGTAPSAKLQAAEEPALANPRQTAAMFASLEQMRSGTCQYPEALMLPESQKSIYIESVVGGQVPTIVQDQQVFGELLQKVRCNYTPMLMANSTG